MKGNRLINFGIGGGDFAVGNPACFKPAALRPHLWKLPLGRRGCASIPNRPRLAQDSVKVEGGVWLCRCRRNKGNV